MMWAERLILDGSCARNLEHSNCGFEGSLRFDIKKDLGTLRERDCDGHCLHDVFIGIAGFFDQHGRRLALDCI